MDNLDTLTVTECDTFRILLATDCHLGYAESDPERGDDSFVAFEEILTLAKCHQVDFVLLGGDLFHENRPSTYSLHKCMSLLRRYCLGDKPNAVEFLSDPEVNFLHKSQSTVNYYDPNLNVSIPVFSIHGNHDDPSGQQQLCSLDILSTSGLVNYFGKWTDLNQIKVYPILLRKGRTRLAIYGLSHIKDDRLSRLFRDEKVEFVRPEEYKDDWFNIFVCHQNRADRGVGKFLAESDLPSFLDLIIWGHEHECRIVPELRTSQEFFITQPGSSVATSLSEGEATKKFVGLLSVYGKKFKLEPLPLKTVRPFIFETLKLAECNMPQTDDNVSSKVQEYLEERLDFWLAGAQSQLTGHPKQPTLPLIRIRVEYKNEDEAFNTIRFGQRFLTRVANPNDMVLLKREKMQYKRNNDGVLDLEEKLNFDELLENEKAADDWEEKMDYYMKQYFDTITKRKMRVLTLKGMSDAVASFIEKSDKDRVQNIMKHQMSKVEDHLYKKKIDPDKIDEEIEKFHLERTINSASEIDELRKIESHPFAPKSEDGVNMAQDDNNEHADNGDGDSTDEDVPMPQTTAVRGRGGRGGRARGTTAGSRGKGRGSLQSTQKTTTRASRSSSTTSVATSASSNGGRTTRSSNQAQSSARKKIQFNNISDSDSS